MGFAPLTNPAIVVVVTLNGTHGNAGIRRQGGGPGVPRRGDRSAARAGCSQGPAGDAGAHGRWPATRRTRTIWRSRTWGRADPTSWKKAKRMRRRPAATAAGRADGSGFQRHDHARGAGGSGRKRPAGDSGRQRSGARAASAGRERVAAGRADSGAVFAMKLGEILSGIRLRRPTPPELAGAEVSRAGVRFAARAGRATSSSLFRAAAPMAASSRGPRWSGARWRWPANRLRRPASRGAGLKWITAGRRWRWRRATFYGKPDEQVALTGITGTNGKTTTGLSDRFGAARGRARPRRWSAPSNITWRDACCRP